MSQEVQIMAATFSDAAKARQCLDQLKHMEREGTIDLIDGAILEKQQDGKLKITELAELTPKKGRRRGAIIGGIFGAIFPPSLIGTAIAGAIAGDIIGRVTDQGVDNDDLKATGNKLAAGETAVVAIIEDRWIEQFSAAISGYDRLSKLAIDSNTAMALIAAADKESGEAEAVLGVRVNVPDEESEPKEIIEAKTTEK